GCKTASGSTMSEGDKLPESIRALIGGSSQDQLDGLALHAIVRAADESGIARVRDVAANYRDDYLRALRVKGADVEREAGRLAQDEVRSYLTTSILPRLAERGVLVPLNGDLERDTATVRLSTGLWTDIAPRRAEFAEVM